MKSTPILFSTDMATAIIAGNKTQTRRIINPQPKGARTGYGCKGGYGFGYFFGSEFVSNKWQTGDLLWVREPHYRFGHWEPVEGVKTKGGRQKWRFVADSDQVLFDAPRQDVRVSRCKQYPLVSRFYKRLARFMPRSLSRITLEIESVRVERLHDIGKDGRKAKDVLAEGITDAQIEHWRQWLHPDDAPAHTYGVLWDSINGPGSWAANPFVWVITFKCITPWTKTS